MDENDLKLLIAQQVVLLKRIEKLEKEIRGGCRMAPVSAYQEELEREAMKIIDQIEV